MKPVDVLLFNMNKNKSLMPWWKYEPYPTTLCESEAIVAFGLTKPKLEKLDKQQQRNPKSFTGYTIQYDTRALAAAAYDKFGSWKALKRHVRALKQAKQEKLSRKKEVRDARREEVRKALAPYNIKFEDHRWRFSEYIEKGKGYYDETLAQLVERTREADWYKTRADIDQSYRELERALRGTVSYPWVSQEEARTHAQHRWRTAHPKANVAKLPSLVRDSLLALGAGSSSSSSRP